MRRVYKILAIVVLVLVILCLGAPYFFGFAAERYVLSFVRHQNTTFVKAVGMQLDVQNYHRGWFRSTADLLVQRTVNGQQVTLQKLPIYIQHGPIYKAHHHFTAGLGVIRSQEKVADPNAPYNLAFDESIAFDGQHTLLVEVDSQKKADFIPGIGFRSLTLKGNSTVDAKDATMHVDIKDLHAATPADQFSLNIKNTNLLLTASHQPNQTWKMNVGVKAHEGAFVYHTAANKPSVSGQFGSLNIANFHIDTEKLQQLFVQAMVMEKQADQSQKGDAVHQPSYNQWMTLFRQMFSSMLSADSSVDINGVVVNTPFGSVKADYQVSFPTLPEKHDYFDVATHEVGRATIEMPNFHVMSDQHNVKFLLTNLSYAGHSNTIFSRRATMKFDTASLQNIHPDAANSVDLQLKDFSFNGELSGDINQLSQTLQWQLDQLCWQTNCFKKLNMEVQFLNMDAKGFRQIAGIIDQFAQEQNSQGAKPPMVIGMDLLHAYSKLIGPNTKFNFVHTMTSPKGEIALRASVSWPEFPKSHVISDLMAQSVYQVHLLFPAAYIDDFIAQHPIDTTVDQPSGAEKFAAWLRFAISKGYLKKENDLYSADLKGKAQSFTVNGQAWEVPSNATLGLDQKPAISDTDVATSTDAKNADVDMPGTMKVTTDAIAH